MTNNAQLRRREDTQMRQVLDSKVAIMIIGGLLALASYFLVKRDGAIDENTAASITAAQTLINISSQMNNVMKNQDEQTKQIKKNTAAYISLERKVDINNIEIRKGNRNLNKFCNETKLYEKWAAHTCDYE